ncbi:MAG: hypothetical protein Q8916_11770 [Bacteroidota bacterium]|nr:hypothetical protein [Bacteroidota bacterium]MDP4231068.1 hypothetical protein [Bacteroidota bacterium]MDP4235627.1 hypothetical protein [Bacteroidota bacterium]
MEYLHVGIIEEFEECLASFTELGLRNQIAKSLSGHSLAILTDQEWLDCVKADGSAEADEDCVGVSLISYYKIESDLGIKA